MAHRKTRRPTYRIDRLFRGVGRIALASGATTKGELKKRNDLLTRLHDKGRLDILRAIKARDVTITEAYAADREDRLDTLVGVEKALSRDLWATVDAWVPTSARGAPTRRRYELSFGQLKKRWPLANSEEAKVATLAEVNWVELERSWPGSGSDWNHLRRAVSKFLTDTLGDVHHPFRRAIINKKTFPIRKEVERIPDISPDLFWKIVEHAPEHVRASYVVMAALGLDTGEYLELSKEHLRPSTFSIEAPGTKTYARHGTLRVDPRLWPWVEAGVPSKVQYRWLREHWKRALAAAGADTSLRLKDLRHCTAQWATNEGVAEAKVQVFMRHTNPSMTRRYSKQKDRGEVATAVANAMLRSA